MDRIEIVACTDKRFVMTTGVMIYSVCKNNRDVDVRFHIVVDEGVSENDINDLQETVAPFINSTICFYHVNKNDYISLPALENRANITQATYYRLNLAEMLPSDINRVLYLDGDVIVRHSLISLWNTPLEGYALAAVCDQYEADIERYNRQHYPPSLGHFSAGVLLINLCYWRNNNVKEDFYQYIKEHREEIRYHDQDVLNYVFRDRKVSLPIKYNLQNGFLHKTAGYDYWKYEKEVLEARIDPVIVHFTDKKPWERSIGHPYESTFFAYQNETKWRGYKERASMKTIIKRLGKAIMVKIGVFPENHFFLDLPPID